jgi:prepilin-type N-terminal cleavage/methylation domain-containing protein
MQKYLRNNKGFTLVEVIVVAVIVLILAAVAIPLYNGYIQDARVASVENAAGAVASAMGAAVQTGQIGTGGVTWTPTGVTGLTNAAVPLTITAAGGRTNQILIPKDIQMEIGSTTVTATHMRSTSVTAGVQFGM